MKKKAVIIIIACVAVLAGIILAYFTLPISYAGTSEKNYIGVLDKHKLILPTEAQASLIKKGMLAAAAVLFIYQTAATRFCPIFQIFIIRSFLK